MPRRTSVPESSRAGVRGEGDIPDHVVMMGVSGCGKTTVARAYAEACGLEMADADDFHTEENVRKMASGQPLSDVDRHPWLVSVRDWMTSRAEAGVGTVTACSALRRSYRNILADAVGTVWFVHLTTDAGLTRRRLEERTGHFMSAALLNSQLETLEPLGPGEKGITVDNSGSLDEVVATICRSTGRNRRK
ncbi:gluconokinase [Corynebacterium sp. P7003]|uniref:Gluconokinase n=1 Tax=Corynebacterium pygosceleis TaxID=2800406 RepID=A0ABT3WU38_9CORY|nr:gluconokinase [Corynebacterium pygosceleis]MCX7445735.1 gluconokinase [Corynebacterium pygosceleis]